MSEPPAARRRNVPSQTTAKTIPELAKKVRRIRPEDSDRLLRDGELE
jgi:hypothetical protein